MNENRPCTAVPLPVLPLMKPLPRAAHLNRFLLPLFLFLLLVLALTACDSDTTPTPGAGPNPTSQLTQTAPPPTNTSGPTATPTPTGPVTALTALSLLKPRALAWRSDAQLVMLANVRPGQAVLLLGVALGDPLLTAATPNGKGENWTLLASSPSSSGVMAFSLDGSQVDMVAQGRVPAALRASLTPTQTQTLPLSLDKLDLTALKDSDLIAANAGKAGQAADVSLALLAPTSLGFSLNPEVPRLTVSFAPTLAYELFTADPNHPSYAFFDAYTGETLLLSSR